MPFKNFREEVTRFLKVAWPNEIEEDFKRSKKSVDDYLSDRSGDFQIGSRTLNNWWHAVTTPDTPSELFVASWIMKREMVVNSDGYLEFVDRDSSLGSNENSQTGISIVANRRG